MTKKSEFTDEALIRSSFQRAARNREQTAYHEGGHVAAGWALHVPLWGDVTIKSDFTCRGSSSVGRLISAADQVEALHRALLGLKIPCTIRTKFESQIQVLFAGRLAAARAILSGEAKGDPVPGEGLERQLLGRDLRLEQLAMGTAAEKVGQRSGPDDDEMAAELLATISRSPKEHDLYGELLWERTRLLVEGEHFWTITTAVAKALLGVETLSMTATRRVIREALQPQPRELEQGTYILEPPTTEGER